MFTFAPNAVLIGFLSSFAGGIVGMTVMALSGTAVIIPGIVAHFMTGAASGVIGNGAGGRWGAVLGAFANGLAITFLPLLLLPVLGDVGLSNSTFSDANFGIVGLILGHVSSAGGQAAVIITLVVALLAVYGSSLALRARNNRREQAAAEEHEKETVPAG